jgi:putative FmdB family regulatory protein
MPNYDYRCEKCGHTFEVWQKITEEPLSLCPKEKCKGRIARVVGPSGFILKGSGWYATDYKSKGKSSDESKS